MLFLSPTESFEYFYIFFIGWMALSLKQHLFKLCSRKAIARKTGVAVCALFITFSVARVFLFVSLRCKTHHRDTTPLHTLTHTQLHTNLRTQTYPGSTAATQQMWRAGFNFLAPRLSPSLMHFSSPPSCSQPATAAAQWYWLAIKPSNCYKEVNILKLLRFSSLLTLMCTL